MELYTADCYCNIISSIKDNGMNADNLCFVIIEPAGSMIKK